MPVLHFMQDLQTMPVITAQHQHLLLSQPPNMANPNRNFYFAETESSHLAATHFLFSLDKLWFNDLDLL
jgi:hypothetical protein